MEQKSELLRSFYSNLAPIYDQVTSAEEVQWITPSVVNEYLEKIMTPNMSVLDIGVGTGQSIDMPYQMGCNVSGFDLSPEMIQVVHASYPKATFAVLDLEKEWHIDQSYDVIIASSVLEYIGNIDHVFSEVQAHIKTKGYFVFTYEQFVPGDPLQQFKEAELGRGLADHIPKKLSFYLYRRTEEELKQLLKLKDFAVLHTGEFVSYFKQNGRYPVASGIMLVQKQ